MTTVFRIFRACVARSLVMAALALTPFSLFAATPLDINTATAEQFAAVMSGVGAKKAKAIIAYRDANGQFESIEQLSEVKGIGEGLLSRNKDLLQVILIDNGAN